MKKELLQNIMKEILREHLPSLKNLDTPRPSLLICFSGIPSSGKTTLAKKIEKRYQAVRIHNDFLRKIITHTIKKQSEKEKEELNQEILHHYLFSLSDFLHRQCNNLLIILDSSVDRIFPDILKWCKRRGMPYFLIRLDIPLRIIKERLRQREMRKPERNTLRMKKWILDFKRCRKYLKASITLRGNSAKEEARVFRLLDKKLHIFLKP